MTQPGSHLSDLEVVVNCLVVALAIALMAASDHVRAADQLETWLHPPFTGEAGDIDEQAWPPPDWPRPIYGMPDFNQPSPPAESPITIAIGDHLYRLPYGYLDGSWSVTRLKPVNKWGGMSVIFWMPDGRYWVPSGLAGAQLQGFKPEENGRTPGPGEFTVYARIRSLSGGDCRHPDQQLANRLARFGVGNIAYREVDEMLELRPLDKRHQDFSLFFGTPTWSREPARGFLDCHGHEPSDGRFPNCHGDLVLSDFALCIQLIMPTQERAHYPAAIRQLRALLTSWRITESNTQTPSRN